MSYSIIFETKFIKLSDDRLLHLDRSGCNNDTSGREKGRFEGKIYTQNELQERINSFIKEGKTEGWDLKIGNRYVTYYDYGKHLDRMSKRAKTYEKFQNERYFTADRYDGVELYEPEQKILSPKEFDDVWDDYFYSGKKMVYRRLFTSLKTENEITEALDNGCFVDFYVGKQF